MRVLKITLLTAWQLLWAAAAVWGWGWACDRLELDPWKTFAVGAGLFAFVSVPVWFFAWPWLDLRLRTDAPTFAARVRRLAAATYPLFAIGAALGIVILLRFDLNQAAALTALLPLVPLLGATAINLLSTAPPRPQSHP